MLIQFEDIIIRQSFKEHPPKAEKLDRERAYYAKHGEVSNQIYVNEKSQLVDGYVRYLVLSENNFSGEIDVAIRIDPSYKTLLTTYVFGKHPGNDVEYVWRYKNGESDFAKPNDTILVQTKYGISPIVVTRVETLHQPPVQCRIKKVVRNGV